MEFRRKRLGKTDYRRRERLLKSGKPRFVVRVTNKYVISQIVEYNPEGDKTLLSANSKELRGYGWKADLNNTPAAYLTGLLCGYKALKENIKESILDRGFQSGSKIYAALEGAIDAGLKIPHDPKVFPKERRIKGEHISDYAKKLKRQEKKFKKRFSKYLERGLDPTQVPKNFIKVKKRIKEKWKK